MAMRKTVAALISLAAISGLARTSSATVIAHEDFNYMGDINGDNGGTGFSSPYSSSGYGTATASQPGLGGSPSLISLEYPNDSDSTGTPQEEENVLYVRSIANPVDTGNVYVSFKTNTVASGGDDSFIYDGGNLLLGHNDSDVLGIVNQGGVQETAGQTYYAVYQLDYDTGNLYFYNDPAPGADPDPSTADAMQSFGVGQLDELSTLYFRQQELDADNNGGAGIGETQYSDLTIGTTYADVAFPAASVPEPTMLSLIGLAGMGLIGRRRRQI